MSLKKYAKENTRETHDRPVSFRMNSAVYNEFEEYCNSLNLDVSEALRLLVHEELKKKSETNERPRPISSFKPRRKTNKRFTIEPYVNPDGKTVTCPICQAVVTRSNVSRHSKDIHGMTTQEVFEGKTDA